MEHTVTTYLVGETMLFNVRWMHSGLIASARHAQSWNCSHGRLSMPVRKHSKPMRIMEAMIGFQLCQEDIWWVERCDEMLREQMREEGCSGIEASIVSVKCNQFTQIMAIALYPFPIVFVIRKQLAAVESSTDKSKGLKNVLCGLCTKNGGVLEKRIDFLYDYWRRKLIDRRQYEKARARITEFETRHIRRMRA